jgi:hypothetical protein
MYYTNNSHCHYITKLNPCHIFHLLLSKQASRSGSVAERLSQSNIICEWQSDLLNPKALTLTTTCTAFKLPRSVSLQQLILVYTLIHKFHPPGGSLSSQGPLSDQIPYSAHLLLYLRGKDGDPRQDNTSPF